jgi:DNA primase
MSEVEKILTEKGVYFLPKGKDVLVKCFNPEHEDSHPSMRIDRESGLYHCLSCGHKGNLFFKFNKYRNIFSTKVRDTRDKLLKILMQQGLDLPVDFIPYNKPFKDISAKVINNAGTFTSEELMPGRVIFPIGDGTGKIIAFLGRYEHSKVSPKYIIYPENVELPLYPQDIANSNSIILVEGYPDALFLKDRGIPNAVACFGTKTLTEDNIVDKLTPYLLQGVERVYIMMDGDAAGYSASRKIKEAITTKTDLLVDEIFLEEGDDPATLSEEDLEELRCLISKNG